MGFTGSIPRSLLRDLVKVTGCCYPAAYGLVAHHF